MPMTVNERAGRWLFASIAGVLLLFAALLIWASFYQAQRRFDLSELALQRTQQLLQIRLDGFFHELAEDLREEAAAVDQNDSAMVFGRWFPLLETHWPILAIRLADENGNEVAVVREDSTYRVMRTAEGSKDGPPILMRYSTGAVPHPVRGPWLHDTDHDPRERLWFGKALEETQGEPSWTLRMRDSTGTPVLQLSHLIRARQQNEPYRIIEFSVDLTRSPWMDTRSASLLQAGILLMDDEANTLVDLNASNDADMAIAVDHALSSWKVSKTKAPFTVQGGERTYRCLVSSYPLHGQALNTGVVVDLEPLGVWLKPELVALYVIAILLAVLTVLLFWAWNRKRSSDERIRKQAKRNRSQELKLAKALGEREVLNREVHHRVKNNLQVVSSLLNLQAMRLEEGDVKTEFLRGKRRIDTIALVHHKLYGLADLRNVDLNLFFSDLVKALAEMYLPQSRSVSYEISTTGIKADQDTAIELGIILCELVANTYQHAFPYATGGHVEVRVQAVEGDLYRLAVKDNGKGIGAGEHQGSGKLGLEIVEALSEQLDGSFHMRTQEGVLFEVLFRMQHEVSGAGSKED
ncbi:MAG: sensor histidine kinase [Flavobacteriales bacterium]|nr:sensor histidine kinase [Flavobacteriales bacterium]